jgi:hypothetical protein
MLGGSFGGARFEVGPTTYLSWVTGNVSSDTPTARDLEIDTVSL